MSDPVPIRRVPFFGLYAKRKTLQPKQMETFEFLPKSGKSSFLRKQESGPFKTFPPSRERQCGDIFQVSDDHGTSPRTAALKAKKRPAGFRVGKALGHW
jgi:hypothetical protein